MSGNIGHSAKRKSAVISPPGFGRESKILAMEQTGMNMEHFKAAVREVFDEKMEPLMNRVATLEEENCRLRADVHELKKHMADMQYSSKAKNLIFRGLPANADPKISAMNCIENNLKVSSSQAPVTNVRKIHEYNGNMTVAVEFDNAQAVRNVLSNVKNLHGTKIFIEKDLDIIGKEKRNVMNNLKKVLAAADGNIRTIVRNDRLRISGEQFYWDKNYELKSNGQDGKGKLLRIYGNRVDQSVLSYSYLMNLRN